MSLDHPSSPHFSSLFSAFSRSVPATSRKAVSPDSDDPSHRPLSILVAEDDPVGRLVLNHLLTKLGHKVLAVASGLEVLDLLQEQDHFDLLLTDIKMPQLSGIDLCRILRSDQRFAHRLKLTIIAMTAFGVPGGRTAFIEAGMDDFLPKPIDGRLLKIVLEQLTARPQ